VYGGVRASVSAGGGGSAMTSGVCCLLFGSGYFGGGALRGVSLVCPSCVRMVCPFSICVTSLPSSSADRTSTRQRVSRTGTFSFMDADIFVGLPRGRRHIRSDSF
jgi:hypothetical protein